MANTHILTHIPTVSATATTTTSQLSPEQMMLIDMRVEGLRYAFEHDVEMSDKDCEDLAFINYCTRMQIFEPSIFVIHQFDVTDTLKKYHIIKHDRGELSDYTKEENIQLRKVLLNNWDTISFYEKVIFHALNFTLPHWSYLYPAIPEWIENAKDWINKRAPIIPK